MPSPEGFSGAVIKVAGASCTVFVRVPGCRNKDCDSICDGVHKGGRGTCDDWDTCHCTNPC